MRSLALAVSVALLAGVPVATAHADLASCLGQAVNDIARLRCYEQNGGGTPGSTGDPAGTDPGDLTTYDYLWLPACPGALPSTPGAAEMSCRALNDCADPLLEKFALWGFERTDAAGGPVDGSWAILGFECRDPDDTAVRRQPLRWQDVASEIRRIGIPAGEVEAPGYTLVNLDTTFFTEPRSIDRTLTIIGYTVDVQVDPTSFSWHWGDGSSDTSASPGKAYPSTDVTHTYLRASQNAAPLSLSVDVTYSARYRVDGGAWLDIPDTITITGPSTALPVKQASSVLVQPR